MRAMQLIRARSDLSLVNLPLPQMGDDEVLVRVSACAVCRTDLHIVDGDLPLPRLPLTPGHEIVGTVIARGSNVTRFIVGDRVGIPWLAHTCGVCNYCMSGRENLCDSACFTGYHRDGGYAEFVTANHQFCFAIPAQYSDMEAAPLLCAGLIGFRALRMAGDAKRLGIYGFGAAAHIITQIARWEGRDVYAFTKPNDQAAQRYAAELGAVWTGDSTMLPPDLLDAALLFAPVGALVPAALRATIKGGCVICAGIHMSDIPAFPYEILWHERTVRSVANLTRQDGEDFFSLASRLHIQTRVRAYPLDQANTALDDLRNGRFEGAAVLSSC